MRVRGDLAPCAAFTLEQQPKKPGFVLARFYENTTPFSETIGEQTVSGYEYDEYQLELSDTGNLQEDVYNNFDYYLSVAKLSGENPDDDLESINEHLANVTLALDIVLGVYDDVI